jgi:hypothetical protein
MHAIPHPHHDIAFLDHILVHRLVECHFLPFPWVPPGVFP